MFLSSLDRTRRLTQPRAQRSTLRSFHETNPAFPSCSVLPWSCVFQRPPRTHRRPPIRSKPRQATSPTIPVPSPPIFLPAMKRAAILKAMKLVADWQLQHAEGRYNIDWTYAALYDGMLAASRATGDPRYHDRVLQIANDNHWRLGPRLEHADDEHIGLTYLTFYSEDRNPDHLAPTKDNFDKLLAPSRRSTEQPLVVVRCALHGAARARAAFRRNRRPPLSRLHGSRVVAYHKGSLRSAGASLLPRRSLPHPCTSPMARKSSGRAATAGSSPASLSCSSACPRTTRSVPNMSAQYRDMAARIAALQPADGLWRSGLLDPDAFHVPRNLRLRLLHLRHGLGHPSRSARQEDLHARRRQSLARHAHSHLRRTAASDRSSPSVRRPTNSSPHRVMSTELEHFSWQAPNSRR